MKKLILALVFIMACFIGFSQIKKPDTTKQIPSNINTNIALVQEKIWPLNYMVGQKDSVIIKPRPRLKTRIKL